MKILVVEDAEILRNSLKLALQQFGYIVDTIGNGRIALNMILDGGYDLVILDIMLPEMDGFTILKTIRAKKNGVSVLILSAREEALDKVKGLDLGADDYLSKPFSIDELEARVRSIIRRRSGFDSDSVEIGNLILDRTQRKITVSGKTLELTVSEHLLLETLILNKGRVQSYSNLQSSLKSDFDLISQNALEAHISCVRKKLKSVNVIDLIRTKRSFGYYIG
jgi:DNA-binding response OmpR family regulator